MKFEVYINALIEISETVEAETAEQAREIAYSIAENAGRVVNFDVDITEIE